MWGTSTHTITTTNHHTRQAYHTRQMDHSTYISRHAAPPLFVSLQDDRDPHATYFPTRDGTHDDKQTKKAQHTSNDD